MTSTLADPIRVLHICPELPTPGSPGSMAPTQRQIDSLRRFGVETQVIDMRGIPKLKYLTALPRIRKAARRVDVVHAHFGFCGWLARLATATMRLRPPLVMSFMGDDLLGTPRDDGSLETSSVWFAKINIGFAKRVQYCIVKSAEMAERLAPVPATIIPNGVDLETFVPMAKGQARQELNCTEAGPLILFPGNPDNPRKGYALARQAVAEAEKRLGQSITMKALWGIQPDAVPLWMNACDAMLMTSFVEGSPNVVKEALACNTPVIGVPVGDVPEMLDGVTGSACCPRDSEALGEAIARQIETGAWCDGRAALQRRGLSVDRVAERVLEVYRTVLASDSTAFARNHNAPTKRTASA